MSTPASTSSSGPGRNMRWHLVFWPTCIMVGTIAILGMHELARAFHHDHVRWLGARAGTFDLSLARIPLARAGGYDPAVVYFGDSTVSEYEVESTLHRLTLIALRRQYGHARVFTVSLAAPGSGIDQYSFYADKIAEAGPDLVIWQLSFFQFTDRWTHSNGAPELVGYVDAERLPEILSLPYEHLRLSLSDILLQQGIVRLGLHDLHRELRKSQLRFAHLPDLAGEALNPNRGRSPEARARTLRGRAHMRIHVDQTLRDRYSRAGELVHFDSTLKGLGADDVRLMLLRSGITALKRRGIDVLVYLNPTNFDHVHNLGLYDEAGVARTVEEIRRASLESGAAFLDLHELLRDEDFRDPSGHFVVDDESTVPRRVADEVARAANTLLDERAGQAPNLKEPGGMP